MYCFDSSIVTDGSYSGSTAIFRSAKRHAVKVVNLFQQAGIFAHMRSQAGGDEIDLAVVQLTADLLREQQRIDDGIGRAAWPWSFLSAAGHCKQLPLHFRTV